MSYLYQTVVLSEEALKRIVEDKWLPEDDINEIKIAIKNIDLQKEADSMPYGFTPWGQTIKDFHKELNDK